MAEVKSSITLEQFAKAMRQLDLTHVAPHNRQRAVAEHFFKIMLETVTDPAERAKADFERAAAKARLLNRSRLILPSDV